MQYIRLPHSLNIRDTSFVGGVNMKRFQITREDGVTGVVSVPHFNEYLYPRGEFIDKELRMGVLKPKEQENKIRLAIRRFVQEHGLSCEENIPTFPSVAPEQESPSQSPSKRQRAPVDGTSAKETKPMTVRSIGYRKLGRRWAICNVLGRYLDPGTGRVYPANREVTSFKKGDIVEAVEFIVALVKGNYVGELEFSK